MSFIVNRRHSYRCTNVRVPCIQEIDLESPHLTTFLCTRAASICLLTPVHPGDAQYASTQVGGLRSSLRVFASGHRTL